MAFSPSDQPRVGRTSRLTQSFTRNANAAARISDAELTTKLDQLRQNPSDHKLRQDCTTAILAKATRAATIYLNGVTSIPGLNVELNNGDLVADIATDVTFGTVNLDESVRQGILERIENGQQISAAYIEQAVITNLNKKQRDARNRARIIQERWNPDLAAQTELADGESSYDTAEYDLMREHLAQLPGTVRSVLTMHFLGGQTLRQVAADLGVSLGTASNLKQQGLAMMREAMAC